jgi:hypothetical protein
MKLPSASQPAEDQSTESPNSAAPSKIRALPFDNDAAQEIADALGGTAGLASFRLPSGAVYQVMIPGKDDRPATMLTIWPVIRRVDAINSTATVVFTDITTIDLVGDIEVQFRRSTREYLIVARGGKIIVRA